MFTIIWTFIKINLVYPIFFYFFFKYINAKKNTERNALVKQTDIRNCDKIYHRYKMQKFDQSHNFFN